MPGLLKIFSSRRIYEYQQSKKGGGGKASSFRETGGTYLLCTLSNLRESSGQVFGSTPLLSKYCPVVPEVKTGKLIHSAACFPHCCAALAKRTLLAGSSTQTRCVEYFIPRDIIEEAGTTSFKYMIPPPSTRVLFTMS